MAHTTEKIRLSDGRFLEYLEIGNKNGQPVLFFHGIPGTCKGILSYAHMIPDGVRIISISRPGLGASTFLRNRKFSDWPKDVNELLNHLNIEKCSVVGISGGTPYALVVAAKLPTCIKKVACNGMFESIYNSPIKVTKGMGILNRTGWLFSRAIPRQFNGIRVIFVYPEKLIIKLLHILGFRFFRERGGSLLDAYKQPWGLAWERYVLTKPWGFDVESIKAPIHFWVGGSDVITPPAMAKRVSKKVGESYLHIFEKDGHVSLPEKYFREIVESVIENSTVREAA